MPKATSKWKGHAWQIVAHEKTLGKWKALRQNLQERVTLSVQHVATGLTAQEKCRSAASRTIVSFSEFRSCVNREAVLGCHSLSHSSHSSLVLNKPSLVSVDAKHHERRRRRWRRRRTTEFRSCVNREVGLGSHSLSYSSPIPNKPYGFWGQWSTIIIIICKAPTLRLKALNKHSITHIMYIEMEMLSVIEMYIKKKKKKNN